MANEIQKIQQAQPQGEIILYQPDETVRLEVRLGEETVWLTQQQMAELFGKDRTVVGRHIRNIYKEGELNEHITCAKFAHMGSEGDQQYEYTAYNLDVIISVGYRVKSQRGTKFRQWANKILKEYLLKGYVVNSRILALEQQVEKQGAQLKDVQNKLDFFVQTSLPPVVGVFSGGQVFSARLFVEDLVKMAVREVILIDSYVDAKTFDLLDVRADGVTATIYTERVDASLQRLQVQHNQEHPDMTVTVRPFTRPFHDRFLIIDDDLWHCGASFKDLGRKLFAIDKMGIDKNIILNQL